MLPRYPLVADRTRDETKCCETVCSPHPGVARVCAKPAVSLGNASKPLPCQVEKPDEVEGATRLEQLGHAAEDVLTHQELSHPASIRQGQVA